MKEGHSAERKARKQTSCRVSINNKRGISAFVSTALVPDDMADSLLCKVDG